MKHVSAEYTYPMNLPVSLPRESKVPKSKEFPSLDELRHRAEREALHQKMLANDHTQQLAKENNMSADQLDVLVGRFGLDYMTALDGIVGEMVRDAISFDEALHRWEVGLALEDKV